MSRSAMSTPTGSTPDELRGIALADDARRAHAHGVRAGGIAAPVVLPGAAARVDGGPAPAGDPVRRPGRIDRQTPWVRRTTVALVAVLLASTLGSTALLVFDLLTASPVTDEPGPLLVAGAKVWLGYNVAFALLYWAFDGEGPAVRAHGMPTHPDLAFPQQTSPTWRRPAGGHSSSTTCMSASPRRTRPARPTRCRWSRGPRSRWGHRHSSRSRSSAWSSPASSTYSSEAVRCSLLSAAPDHDLTPCEFAHRRVQDARHDGLGGV